MDNTGCTASGFIEKSPCCWAEATLACESAGLIIACRAQMFGRDGTAAIVLTVGISEITEKSYTVDKI